MLNQRLLTNLTQTSSEKFSGPAGFSPDGRTLAFVDAQQRIGLWDAATLERLALMTNGFNPISLSYSPDSRVLAVSGMAEPGFHLQGITNRLAFWDLSSQNRIFKLPHAAPLAMVVSFSHRGRLLAVGYLDGTVRIWDYRSERLLAEFTDQHRRIWSVAFSPNDAWLAAAGDDGVVMFYDVRRKLPFRPATEGSGGVIGLAFAPDGKTLASTGWDGIIKLWNVAAREVTVTLREHVGGVANVCFSANGKLMSSCGGDGTVRLWQAAGLDE